MLLSSALLPLCASMKPRSQPEYAPASSDSPFVMNVPRVTALSLSTQRPQSKGQSDVPFLFLALGESTLGTIEFAEQIIQSFITPSSARKFVDMSMDKFLEQHSDRFRSNFRQEQAELRENIGRAHTLLQGVSSNFGTDFVNLVGDYIEQECFQSTSKYNTEVNKYKRQYYNQFVSELRRRNSVLININYGSDLLQDASSLLKQAKCSYGRKIISEMFWNEAD